MHSRRGFPRRFLSVDAKVLFSDDCHLPLRPSIVVGHGSVQRVRSPKVPLPLTRSPSTLPTLCRPLGKGQRCKCHLRRFRNTNDLRAVWTLTFGRLEMPSLPRSRRSSSPGNSLSTWRRHAKPSRLIPTSTRGKTPNTSRWNDKTISADLPLVERAKEWLLEDGNG